MSKIRCEIECAFSIGGLRNKDNPLIIDPVENTVHFSFPFLFITNSSKEPARSSYNYKVTFWREEGHPSHEPNDPFDDIATLQKAVDRAEAYCEENMPAAIRAAMTTLASNALMAAGIPFSKTATAHAEREADNYRKRVIKEVKEGERARIRADYKELADSLKSVAREYKQHEKTYFDSAHRATRNGWKKKWKEHGPPLFEHLKREFVEIFAGIDKPTAKEAAVRILAKRKGCSPGSLRRHYLQPSMTKKTAT